MRLTLVLALFSTMNYVIGQSENRCIGGSYDIVKPFVGSWQEYTVLDDVEEFVGTLQTSLDLGGCVISQRFISKDSSFSYLSFGYVQPSSNLWEETYVFSTGTISEYQWLVDDRDVLMRRTGGTRSLDYIHQLRLTNITKDSYEVLEEHSSDGGKTWKSVELTRIKRIN